MNQLKICVASVCCSLLLGACGNESAIKEAVRNTLKDPDSAKFGEITILTASKKNLDGEQIQIACVTVNSKNSMGGYGGDKQATVVTVGDKWEAGDQSFEISHQACIDRISQH